VLEYLIFITSVLALVRNIYVFYRTSEINMLFPKITLNFLFITFLFKLPASLKLTDSFSRHCASVISAWWA